MKIAVSVESTADLTKEIIEKYDIKVIAYNIIHDGKVIKDGEITTDEFLELCESSAILPKTTAINEFEYTEYFENLLKEYDGVIHFCLSGGITSACANAFRASKSLNNVYVVDSLSLSTGTALLAIYARDLLNFGLDIKEVYEKVSSRVNSVVTTFVIEKLNYLYKGGRCNSLQLLGANILKLRPRIKLVGGVMVNDKKYRGSMGAVIAKYAQELFVEYDAPDLTRVFISYTTATEDMIEAAVKACESVGFKEILITRCGSTIASHCGDNTLGILFINDGDKIHD